MIEDDRVKVKVFAVFTQSENLEVDISAQIYVIH